LGNYVDEAWGSSKEIGLSPGASRDWLSFTTDAQQALAQADFVQENGPERPISKRSWSRTSMKQPPRFDHRIEGGYQRCAKPAAR
jgi:hypothetical protein